MLELRHPPRTSLAALLVILTGCDEPSTSALLILDQNAGPHGNGAIFRLDPGAKEPQLFRTSKLLRRPQDVLQDDDGSLLVLDFGDAEGEPGRIFRFPKDDADCEELALPPGLVDPFHFEKHADGSIWIVDKNADPLGLGAKAKCNTGTLWRLSADRQTLEVIATGPPLMAPSAVFFVEGDAFVMDADTGQGEAFDPNVDEGAIFRVHKHPKQLEEVVRFRKLVSPASVWRQADGTFLVVDVNANPDGPKPYHGGIYHVDPRTKATTPFARHADFRDPIRCAMWNGTFLVVDGNADPLGLGSDGEPRFHVSGNGRGGIYAVDLETKEVRLFLASKEFVNPLRLRVARL